MVTSVYGYVLGEWSSPGLLFKVQKDGLFPKFHACGSNAMEITCFLLTSLCKMEFHEKCGIELMQL